MIYFKINWWKLNWIFSFMLSLCFISHSSFSQDKNQWMEYASVLESGFSSEKLDSVTSRFNDLGGAALLVVSEGKVVLSVGDNTRRFMTHSIRKSFLSALIGIEVDKGNLDLDSSLESMGIDDVNPLTPTEKSATLRDLLSARSGIYLPSAYSPRSMMNNLPERGSVRPGEKWLYNNWDFNALVTIYNQATGRDFFDDFDEKIAAPIGMQEFRLMDTYYRYEKDRSAHPAYLLNMSARDMARFGLLYLNGGKWNGKQVIPASWVEKSTSIISSDLGAFIERGGYGYLWWVSETHQGKKMYYASGLGGHRIIVLPEDDMVIVSRSNTYENRMIRENDLEDLVGSIIDAKVSEPITKPRLKEYNPSPSVLPNQYTGSMDQYLGAYEHPFLGMMEITKSDSGYVLKNNIGNFRLFALDKEYFYPEDLEIKVRMMKTEDPDKKHKMESVFNKDRTMKEVICFY